MRLVICDYAGHPFQVELSRCLAERGHFVLHLHAEGVRTPKGTVTQSPHDPPNFQVEGIHTGQKLSKEKFLRRRVVEMKFGELLAQRAMKFNPDLVVGCNMPLDAQKKVRDACAKASVRFVFWLQDILSKATYHYLSIKYGLLGRAIGLYYMKLERELLQSSDAIVAISERFLEPLAQWGISGRSVRVIPNWAPLGEIYPVDKDNKWARMQGLHDKNVALYSGTLGLKQDSAQLLELAVRGKERGIHVVVASEGPSTERLAKSKQEMSLTNLVIVPFQPMNCYPEVLGSADILLATLGEMAGGFSVPSKILSYLAAGKPIVASVAEDNDAASIIRLSQAGYVVAPSDAQAFCNCVFELAADRDLRDQLGRKARAFAELHFDIETITDQFEKVFRDVSHAGQNERLASLVINKNRGARDRLRRIGLS